MLVVKLIVVFLQPVKLGLQLSFAFDVRLHFLVFELELLFVHALLCVKFSNLALTILSDCLGLSKLIR